MLLLFQPLLDLRARAMHQHQPDAQRGKQVEVMRQLDELAIRHHLAAERDNEGLAAESVDIGRDGTEPVNEIIGLEWHVGHSSGCFQNSCN